MKWTKSEKESLVDLSALNRPATPAAVATAVATETLDTPEAHGGVEAVAIAEPPVQATPPEPKLIVPPAGLTPEMQAFMNASMSAAIKEAFASMSGILDRVALTPEKLAAAEALRRAPDPAKVDRDKREKALMVFEQEENAANRARVQATCLHRYPNGQLTLHIVRNYPDRQARGSCPICNMWIHPREWRVGPPTPDGKNPRGTPYIADEHPLYHLVKEQMVAKQ